MMHTDGRASRLWALVRAIAAGDKMAVSKMLAKSPGLARELALVGATRQVSKAHYLHEIEHYVYAGDTALHIAAAAHQEDLVRDLIVLGADVRARNRRGAEPLHYAADGMPGSCVWKPQAQAATIACLVAAGADPKCSGQKRCHAFAPRRAYALRRGRTGARRGWRGCARQGQEWRNAPAPCQPKRGAQW